MTEIRFYHLQTKTLDVALPEILGKAATPERRVVVKTATKDQAKHLNDHLWTCHPDSFLPHGMEGDQTPARQPIWLTDGDDNPNNADVLVLTHDTQCAALDTYSLCCDMFDGRDEQAVAAARTRWKACADAGHSLTYWQQDANGHWQKKAEA